MINVERLMLVIEVMFYKNFAKNRMDTLTTAISLAVTSVAIKAARMLITILLIETRLMPPSSISSPFFPVNRKVFK